MTQTRRVVKFPPHTFKAGDDDWVKAVYEDGGGNWIAWSTDAPGYAEFTKQAYPNGEGFPCPYGKPGERLWVRESCAPWFDRHPTKIHWPIATQAEREGQGDVWRIYYRADRIADDGSQYWLSPIHMPRWASRLTLVLTDVRVERLQEITREDALAEGVRETFKGENFPLREQRMALEQHAYAEAWDSLNLKRGFGWDSNPWVWVLTFRLLTADAIATRRGA